MSHYYIFSFGTLDKNADFMQWCVGVGVKEGPKGWKRQRE